MYSDSLEVMAVFCARRADMNLAMLPLAIGPVAYDQVNISLHGVRASMLVAVVLCGSDDTFASHLTARSSTVTTWRHMLP